MFNHGKALCLTTRWLDARLYILLPTLYAIPQLSDELIALRQVQELEEFKAAVLDLAPAHPEHPAVEVERLRDRHVLVDGQALRQRRQGLVGFLQAAHSYN